MTKLEKAIAKKIELGCADRAEALGDIANSIDYNGLYHFSKMFGLLEDNSAEEFAIEFFTAYNSEISHRY